MVGRRIGSLDHRLAIVDGGTNDWENLAWACLWCNVWTAETDRQPGATDHGALQDCPSDEPKREHPLKREVTYAWNLRDVMRSKGMYVTTDLGPHLADRGFDLSEGQVRRLVSQAPERLSLTLLAALCDIFRCTPADLITIESPSSPPARPLTWRKWST
nr:helix-turn-helix domain-containing protein [Glycomyces amatae]